MHVTPRLSCAAHNLLSGVDSGVGLRLVCLSGLAAPLAELAAPLAVLVFLSLPSAALSLVSFTFRFSVFRTSLTLTDSKAVG